MNDSKDSIWRKREFRLGVNLFTLKKIRISRILSGSIILSLLFIMGCPTPTVITEFDLPNQDLTIKPKEHLSKVVFFNNSNILTHGLDQSGFLTIKLNGKGLATLKIHSYVQAFLEKGQYDLYMAHLDVFLFESNHKLKIDKDEVFVGVSATITSNKFKIVDQLPPNFTEKYQPAVIQK